MKQLKVVGTGILDVNEINKLKEFPKEYGIQRMINKDNVIRIKNSMEQLYIPIVVKVNQDWYILDGQHSKEALKELSLNGAQLAYVMYDTQGRDREVCVLLNTTSKKWDNNDYLQLWVDCNNENYISFKEIKDKFDLSYQATLLLILKANCPNACSKIDKDFKNGQMIITNEQKANALRIGKYLEDVKGYVDKGISSQRNFHKAFIKIAHKENYNHDIMIRKLEYQYGAVKKCKCENDYVEMLGNIYNYRNKNKITFN